jgi:hypothetical protein
MRRKAETRSQEQLKRSNIRTEGTRGTTETEKHGRNKLGERNN